MDMCTSISIAVCVSAIVVLFLADPGGVIPGGKEEAASLIKTKVSSGNHTVHVGLILRTLRVGALIEDEDDEGARTPSMLGDMLALFSGIAMAGYLTACRWAELRCPSAELTLAPAIASLVVSLCTGIWAICFHPSHAASLLTTGWFPLVVLTVGCGGAEAIEDIATACARTWSCDRRFGCQNHQTTFP